MFEIEYAFNLFNQGWRTNYFVQNLNIFEHSEKVMFRILLLLLIFYQIISTLKKKQITEEKVTTSTSLAITGKFG